MAWQQGGAQEDACVVEVLASLHLALARASIVPAWPTAPARTGGQTRSGGGPSPSHRECVVTTQVYHQKYIFCNLLFNTFSLIHFLFFIL